ncbi:hypothetical protein (nucleomorph) [Guillardia theta]|uniref:Uncharacterized protein n=1 Tax=Guillardia theta TaxID=55529 RepID=Q98RS7_GUITH|nr:hypothetical protein GTHECHR1078 [Guillardia theta]AAK39870.1 hypothetical protein [Guillardia theta]|mmetsp:Transcript_4379/g.15996  ORF Transcript_4379/g.15996 Transcript_4379/m.15996 type:complete len:249 (-) Transcript_4379:625-1371(-)
MFNKIVLERNINKIDLVFKLISLVFRMKNLRSLVITKHKPEKFIPIIFYKFTQFFFYLLFLIFLINEKDFNNNINYQYLILIFNQILHKSLYLDFVEILMNTKECIVDTRFLTNFIFIHKIIDLLLSLMIFVPLTDFKLLVLFRRSIMLTNFLLKKKTYLKLKKKIIEILCLRNFKNRFFFNHTVYSIKIFNFEYFYNIVQELDNNKNFNCIEIKSLKQIWSSKQYYIYNILNKKILKKKIIKNKSYF